MNTHQREYEALFEGLVKKRKEKGFSQNDIASRLGKPQSYVSKYEHGERRLDVIEFLQVAKALEVNAFELLSEMDLL